MIEKLKTINPHDETEIDMDTNSVAGLVYENTPLVQKLNELVDIVNELQTKVNKLASNINFAQPEVKENVQDRMIGCTTLDIPESYKTDPYTEQRWIGHLCKLWTGDSLVRYGILRGIAVNRKKTKYPYQALSTSFEHCEPVKPDDSIIYKGEQ